MPDKSGLIIVSSLSILVLIIGYSVYTWTFMPNFSVNDLDIEIVTEKERYILGEEILASVYLVNRHPTEARLKPICFNLIGYNIDEPKPAVLHVDVGGPLLRIPPDGKLLIGRRTFIPENPGLFVLEFKGARHTVQIDVPKAESPQPIVSLRDVGVEVETEKEVYFLGENFTATIYLVNNRSEDVWLKPISEFSISAFSVNDPEPVMHGVHITWEEGTLIHVPAGSRIRLIEEKINPKYLGEFNINCLGAHLSLDVIDPEEMWLDDDSIVVKVILRAIDIRETDRYEYVAISPDESESGLIKVEIKLGEIVKGKDAKMLKGQEFKGDMTAYVRYFQVKRLRIKMTPPRIIGERYGWIDMQGRCYIYEGWDEL